MLAKLIGTRMPRQPAREGLFRPELEALEDRLPPSSMQAANAENKYINTNLVQNQTTITNSLNGVNNSLGSAVIGQNLALLALPQSSLQELFATLYKQAASINATAANALVTNEAQLVIGAILSLQNGSGPTSALSSLQSAIASNSLESSPVGVLLGDVTFDMVLQGMLHSVLESVR